MSKLFCVLVMHNEEKFLPYSIPSLLELGCMVVVVLDRCTDSSEAFIRQHLKKVDFVFKDSVCWVNSCAEAKQLGCARAKELGADYILVSDADIMLDTIALQKAVSILESSDYQIIVLSYWQYSLFGSLFNRIANKTQNLFALVTRRFGFHPVRFGLYIGKADAINIEDVPSEYDVLQEKAKTMWLQTKSLHLRPRFDRESQLHRGYARAGLPQYNLFKVILTSFLLLQPFTLAGYLKRKII